VADGHGGSLVNQTLLRQKKEKKRQACRAKLARRGERAGRAQAEGASFTKSRLTTNQLLVCTTRRQTSTPEERTRKSGHERKETERNEACVEMLFLPLLCRHPAGSSRPFILARVTKCIAEEKPATEVRRWFETTVLGSRATESQTDGQKP
jgi:hypothetical protein